MSWGTVQEPASLHEVLEVFPESVLLEVRAFRQLFVSFSSAFR
jgi:hypothetical protein